MLKKNTRYVLVFLFFACVFMLYACTEFMNDGIQNENNNMKSEIIINNEKGYKLLKQNQPKEAVEYLNKALDYIYKLDPSLIDLKEEKESMEFMDSPLNNLSWAYNMLGENEKSLMYIDKSLLILPNTDEEFVNKGNALYGLNRNDEALLNYNLAIKLNKDSYTAYYGKGSVYYDSHKYEEALKEFNTYLNFNKDDLDAAKYKVNTLLYLEQKQEALAYAEAVFKNNLDNYKAYAIKAIALKKTAQYEDIKKFYEETSKKFPDNLEAQIKLGQLHYDNGYYNLSLDHFNKLLETHKDNMDLYVWIIYNYSKLGDFDNAILNYNKAVKINDKTAELYTAIGSAYVDKTLFLEAVDYFDKSIKLNPTNEDAYIDKLMALYRGKRNLKCIDFGKDSEKVFAASADIFWYIGKCSSNLGNYQEAIDYFKKAVELDPKDDESLSSIAYAYLSLEEYVNAEEYSIKSLKLYSENKTALYVKEALQERKKPIGEQISKFFGDNYLYKDGMVDLDNKLSALNKIDISDREIDEVIGRAKQKDDIFTFVVYGKEYDYLTDSSNNDIEYKNMDNTIYLKINDFNGNTDDKFVEILDKIPGTEKKTLVLDMRGNSGGLTLTSNNMLDTLLPKYVTSTLIYKDGYTDSYYSDASQTLFKKIYILVDEHTASAAELLTLGLKTYLNNVTVIGRNTFGKGVGQQVFEDKKRKIMVFVVNHYWNVKQKNIMHTHIKPDIYVKGNKLDDFMKQVK